MNVHALQSIPALTEASELMQVSKQIVYLQSNKPALGIFQDGLIGTYKLSRKDVFLTRAQVMDFMMQMEFLPSTKNCQLPQPAILKPQALWTGKQIISMMIPSKINMVRKVRNLEEEDEFDHDERLVTIKKGEMLTGALCKQTIGTAAGGLIHLLFRDVEPQASANFMSDMQRVANQYLLYRGLSIGISDCVNEPKIKIKVEEAIDHALDIMDSVNNTKMSGIDKKDIENYLFDVANRVLDQAGRIVQQNTTVDNNTIYAASYCGSKGNPINAAQIRGVVGQQSVDGKRPGPEGCSTRTLPCFKNNDKSALSRGFVAECYADGLTPQGLFFHQMGGREGVIDTAVKSVTGDTLVYVKHIDGHVQCVKIGDWIDGQLDVAGSIVEHYGPEQYNLELLRLSGNVFMPTVDTMGEVTWGALTAVTRHDPGEVLYRMHTDSGRDVTVTASKSVLVYDDLSGKIHEIEPSLIVPGKSRVPVMATVPLPPGPEMAVFRIESYWPNIQSTTVELPKQFALGREFGLICGLYLAGGLANDNPAIQLSVQHCFQSLGVANTIVGCSTLAQIMVHTFGESETEKIPAEFVGAPLPFIVGLFDGYISAEGSISDHDIFITLASSTLAKSLQMLASRMGVFGILSEVGANQHSLSFTGLFARRLCDMVTFTHPEKEQKRINIRTSAEHVNFDTLRDVVLDTVKSIEKVDVTQYPKVYDVTLPSTLNFGIANGLMVRDTSETGYIQRRLIKGMESHSVQHDGTVRNSDGEIVEFVYGTDGMDPVRLEKLPCPVLKWDDGKILSTVFLGLTGNTTIVQSCQELKFLDSNSDQHLAQTFGFCTEHELNEGKKLLLAEAVALIAMRDQVRKMKKTLFNLTPDSEVIVPVPVSRILQLVFDEELSNNSELTASVKQVCTAVNQICSRIAKKANRCSTTNNLQLLIRSHLTCANLIGKHGCTVGQLDFLKEKLFFEYESSFIDAGSMVGAHASDSVGEPSTQLTLNTFQ